MADTALCLESIARHAPEPHEVVVIDNGCFDATSEWCAGRGARVVRSPVNLGFAGGANLGLPAPCTTFGHTTCDIVDEDCDCLLYGNALRDAAKWDLPRDADPRGVMPARGFDPARDRVPLPG